MLQHVTNIQRKPGPPTWFALIDETRIRPDPGLEAYRPTSTTHGEGGAVLDNVKTRGEAEKVRAGRRNVRVVEVKRALQKGDWFIPLVHTVNPIYRACRRGVKNVCQVPLRSP